MASAVQNGAIKHGDKKMFLVKHKYNAAMDDELTLRPGEVVTLIEHTEPGWAKGKLNGKEGLYPTNFVTPYNPTAPLTKGDSKKKMKSSDQHKQDIKAEAAWDDEVDGLNANVGGAGVSQSSEDLTSTSKHQSAAKGDSGHSLKNRSSSHTALEDTTATMEDNVVYPPLSSSNVSKGGGLIKSAVKRAQKVLPSSSHQHSKSYSTSDAAAHSPSLQSSKNKTSSTTTTSEGSKSTRTSKTSGSSKTNKSMESLNSLEDEHENPSRGSRSSSGENLSEPVVKVTAAKVADEDPVDNLATSPVSEKSSEDNLDLDLLIKVPATTTPCAKLAIPRQNKRNPSQFKLRLDAETAEKDREEAAEKARVELKQIAEEEDTTEHKPKPNPLKVGGHAIPGLRMPGPGMGGMGFLSELKKKQGNKQTPQPSPSADQASPTSPTSENQVQKDTTSSDQHQPSPSAAAKVTGQLAPGQAAFRLPVPGSAPTKPLKPQLAAGRPASTFVSPSTTTTPPAASAASDKRRDSALVATATPPMGTTTNQSSVPPPFVAVKPVRPPPPQVPDKPKTSSMGGRESESNLIENELRTVKDTVTRMERRVKELESYLDAEQEARKKLEAKVDALMNKK